MVGLGVYIVVSSKASDVPKRFPFSLYTLTKIEEAIHRAVSIVMVPKRTLLWDRCVVKTALTTPLHEGVGG